MNKLKVAAVTMTYNEPDYVPIWLRHFSRHVGLRHCYMVDHGSDDGSTEGLGPEINLIRLPRTPLDEGLRCRFIRKLCASLLEYYDFVVNTDIDEIVIPDPRHFATIRDYCEATEREVTTAIGLNVQHVPAEEPDLDLDRPITEQRRNVWLGSTMCKPLLIRREVDWSQGFHCCEVPPVFDRLYMFHLRWYDLRLGLRRLAKTRAMPWADEHTGLYQRTSDAEFVGLFNGLANRPRRFDIDPDVVIAASAETVRRDWTVEKRDNHHINLRIASVMCRLPDRFVGAF